MGRGKNTVMDWKETLKYLYNYIIMLCVKWTAHAEH